MVGGVPQQLRVTKNPPCLGGVLHMHTEHPDAQFRRRLIVDAQQLSASRQIFLAITLISMAACEGPSRVKNNTSQLFTSRNKKLNLLEQNWRLEVEF